MSQRSSADLPPETLERIELAFPALVGGFQVHERELTFDGKEIADFLAYSQGRILLVSVVDGASDDTVLRALDGLAFARRQTEILAQSVPGLSPQGLRTRVVLVAVNGFSALQLDRLEALRGDELWLLRKRELRSKRGSHTRLEPLDVSDGLSLRRSIDLPEWALREPYEVFLAQVAPDQLELASSLVERVRRVDPALEWKRDGGLLTVEQAGQELCALEWIDGHLLLSLGPDRAPLIIRDAPAIDEAVDELLRVYLARLGVLPRATRPPAELCVVAPSLDLRSGRAPTRAARARRSESVPHVESSWRAKSAGASDGGSFEEEPFDGAHVDAEFDDADFEGSEDLAEVDLRPMAAGPLLTAEEIRAFQE